MPKSIHCTEVNVMLLQFLTEMLIVLLAAVGIIEVWQRTRRYFFMLPQDRVSFIVRSRGHDEKIEYIIRSLLVKAGELKVGASPAIFIVDDGMDEETRKICEHLADRFACIDICEPKELPMRVAAKRI